MMAEKKKEAKGLIYNNNLSTIYADSLQFNFRSDDIIFLRFLTQAPEGLVEQARIIVPKNNLLKMIEVMCNSLKYQPKMEKSEKEEK